MEEQETDHRNRKQELDRYQEFSNRNKHKTREDELARIRDKCGL